MRRGVRPGLLLTTRYHWGYHRTQPPSQKIGPSFLRAFGRSKQFSGASKKHSPQPFKRSPDDPHNAPMMWRSTSWDGGLTVQSSGQYPKFVAHPNGPAQRDARPAFARADGVRSSVSFVRTQHHRRGGGGPFSNSAPLGVRGSPFKRSLCPSRVSRMSVFCGLDTVFRAPLCTPLRRPSGFGIYI